MSERSPQRRTVKVDGKQVGFRYWPGKGRPVILIHGFLDSSEGWDTVCAASNNPCYALDVPGFGRSAIPEAPKLEFYAQRLARAAEKITDGPALWVGHSMGGAIGRQVADGKYSGLINELALITPAGFGTLPLAEWADGPWTRRALTVAFPALSLNPLSVLLAYPSQVSGGKPAEGAMVTRTMRSALRGPQGPSWAVQTLAHMSRQPTWEILAQSNFKGPVRSLWGVRDRLIPSGHAVNVKKVFPQARITIWEDLAHHPQAEQPRRLQRWLEHSLPH